MADLKKDQEREELFRTIYKIATDLVHAGHVSEWDFKSYVLGTMFYRYISENFTAYINAGEHAAGNVDFDYAKMSDAEAETAREGLVQEKGFFILPSELFCNVLARADKDENLNETLERVFAHIESSAASGDAESDFAGLFDDFDVNSKSIGETVAKRNKVLAELLHGVARMPLFDTDGINPDLFGDAYEYLMGMYAANAGKKGGQYFTPADVSELLARLGTIGKTKINKVYDLILTKSIQRFARNTLDCINYTRILRQLGIGVLFEKENINSLPADSEFMITMYGAMAQSESESISGNIRRGRQMHAKVGTLKVPCYRLYGYEKDAEGKFRVIPEQAEIVREIYKRYESGASLRNLQDWLEENQIKTVLGESKWTTTSIKSILTNEKYCGDVLLQKTFRTDVISKKVIKNVGQMTQYYMPDHHEGIVSREQYNAVKAEMARRSALRSPSKTAVTGRSCYTSKFALSDRLVCGECGTLYRRCTWTSLGRKYPVWRCTSRLNYGTKYCHDSPTIKEEPLQNAILAAINSAMSNKPALLNLIKNAVSVELLPVQGQSMSLADIERRLAQLDEQFQSLLAEAIDAEDKEACNAQFAEILAEQTALKEQKEEILQSSMDADRVCTRIKEAEEAIENTASTITEWSENAVRQIVERVTVLSADEILVRIKGGAEIKQTINK